MALSAILSEKHSTPSYRHPSEDSILSVERCTKLFANTHTPRHPSEGWDPEQKTFLEEVFFKNCPLQGIIFNWIPAFAGMTIWVWRFPDSNKPLLERRYRRAIH